jgi:hypothetical protein
VHDALQRVPDTGVIYRRRLGLSVVATVASSGDGSLPPVRARFMKIRSRSRARFCF